MNDTTRPQLVKLGTATLAELELVQIEGGIILGIHDALIEDLNRRVGALQKRVQSLEILAMANAAPIKKGRGKETKR